MHVRCVVRECTDWSRHGECQVQEEVKLNCCICSFGKAKETLWPNLALFGVYRYIMQEYSVSYRVGTQALSSGLPTATCGLAPDD
jgi:hypothetical protein